MAGDVHNIDIIIAAEHVEQLVVEEYCN